MNHTCPLTMQLQFFYLTFAVTKDEDCSTGHIGVPHALAFVFQLHVSLCN